MERTLLCTGALGPLCIHCAFRCAATRYSRRAVYRGVQLCAAVTAVAAACGGLLLNGSQHLTFYVSYILAVYNALEVLVPGRRRWKGVLALAGLSLCAVMAPVYWLLLLHLLPGNFDMCALVETDGRLACSDTWVIVGGDLLLHTAMPHSTLLAVLLSPNTTLRDVPGCFPPAFIAACLLLLFAAYPVAERYPGLRPFEDWGTPALALLFAAAVTAAAAVPRILRRARRRFSKAFGAPELGVAG